MILAIFENRATTRIARLQVEQASLQKLLPRLIGANTQLGRQSGSGKNKGTGEKQLELDRRRIKARIHEVARELKKVEQERDTQRKARQKSDLPLVSLVGYTNAGKSTIMNAMLSYSDSEDCKKVVEKDMLFATLDTSVRKIHLPNGDEFLLSDTVGFVNHLPHTLVKAFASTLEEVTYASLLIQVVDASSSEIATQMETTKTTLKEIKAAHIPMITVYNKCDKTSYDYPHKEDSLVFMSATTKQGFPELFTLLHEHLYPNEKEVQLVLPYAQSAKLSELLRKGRLVAREDREDGIFLTIYLSDALLEKYQSYLKK